MAELSLLSAAPQDLFSGKKVLVRVDFNVPLKEGHITDDTRIRRALPTIEHLLKLGASPLIMSHLGRPSGTGFEEAYSLKVVADRLQELLEVPVKYASDTVGAEAVAQAKALGSEEVLVLENLRFDAREKQNDSSFAQELAALGDAYVNDAFGCAHRAHASVSALAKLLPSFAGFLMENELINLGSILDNPARPFVSILGGSKVSDKIKIISSLIEQSDTLIIGGAMCFTFLKALGYQVGTSLVQDDWCNLCLELLEKAQAQGCKLLLPVDVVCADGLSADAQAQVCSIDAIPKDLMGLDIGPATQELYASEIARAQTAFWNGPMGVFEIEQFAQGTRAVAEALADNMNARTIIGGGDSVAAVNLFNLANKMSFISTGGGASMAFVQGDTMPGVEPLMHDK